VQTLSFLALLLDGTEAEVKLPVQPSMADKQVANYVAQSIASMMQTGIVTMKDGRVTGTPANQIKKIWCDLPSVIIYGADAAPKGKIIEG
jgi:hypothetical protein